MHGPKISPPTTPRRNSLRSAGSQLSGNTNSLVVTGFSKEVFEQQPVLDALREHFTTYGPLYAWAPLKSFLRVIVVYYSESDAERAKLGSDGVSVDASNGAADTILRVFRAEPVKIHMPSTCCEGKKVSPHHLRPPTLKKNFLVSPPGSPSPHWKQRPEEPPATDLMFALRELKATRDHSMAGSGSRPRRPSVLVKPEEGSGVGIYLQPCEGRNGVDSDNEFSDMSLPNTPVRRHRMPVPAARPPMSVV